jgi:CubicO group peptidase (beta-lactamase class C family)
MKLEKHLIRFERRIYMAIRVDKKALSFLYRFFVKGSSDARQITYIPQKTRIMGENRESKLKRATPESRKISSRALLKMLEELEGDRASNVHTVAVYADDAVICEASAFGYDFNNWHLTHSMCKTVTGLAIGMLVDEGLLSLDTPAYTILDDDLPSLLSSKMKQVTVRHLLTMSSGNTFNEIGSVTSENWVRSFFEAPVDFEPGKCFAYNSMNTYMLSAIVKKITGVGLSDFLRPRLFDILGVSDFYWETCPSGIEKGGWGLYITTETMIKLGTLFINGGKYGDKRIVSAEWIDEMKACQINVEDESRNYDYGYQMWVGRKGDCCLFNGMLGQNILVFPKKRIVVAVTSANSELFQRGKLLSIIYNTFCDGSAYTEKKSDRHAFRELLKKENTFFYNRRFIKEAHHTLIYRLLFSRHNERIQLKKFMAVAEKDYFFEKNNLSFMPTFASLVQNNLGEGLSALRISLEESGLYFVFTEGKDVFKLRFGLNAPVKNTVNVRGEEYIISAWAQFTENEDGRELLKLELLFPELPAVRRMKLYFDEKGVGVRMLELPDKEVLGDFLNNMKAVAPKSEFLVNLIRPQLEREYIAYKIADYFEPYLYAKKESKPTNK